MDIQDLGAIGEFVSSMVIMITLIFLVLETRYAKKAMFQGNRQLRQQIQYSIYTNNTELINSLMKANLFLSSEFGEGYEKLAQGWGLNSGEYFRVIHHFRAEFGFLEDQYFTDLAIIDRVTIDAQFLRTMRAPSSNQFWKEQRHHFHSTFVKYGDDLIEKSGVLIGQLNGDYREKVS